MTLLISLAFVFIILLSFIGSLKNNEKILAFSDLFLIVSVSGFFISPYLPESGESSFIWGFLMYMSMAILLSSFVRLNYWLRLASGLLSTFIFVTVSGFLENGEYVVSIADPKSLMLVALGFSLTEIAALKSCILSKIFKSEKVEMENIILSAMIGFSLFLSYFFASSIGLLFTTVGFGFHTLLFNRNRQQLNALLLICTVFPLATLNGFDSIDLTLGKTLEGLFFGVFSAAFLDHISASSKVMWRNFLALIISVLLLIILLVLGTQKSDLGGIDAYVSAMLGISIYFIIKPVKSVWGSILSALVLMIGIISTTLSYTIDEKVKIEDSEMIPLRNDEKKFLKEIDLFDVEGESIDRLSGEYTIDTKKLEFNFELGPKGGRTKGLIKGISGNIVISENIEKSRFTIEIPVSQLSTKNKFRDESLMGEEYFNVSKFPTMIFTSNTLVRESDYYLLKGQFNMLGVSKDVLVEVKNIKTNDSSVSEPILIGRGKIDRTLFGMKSDPKEGNVVDFNFKIQFKRRG